MTTQLLPAKQLLNTIAGYAEVYPVLTDASHVMSRTEVPGFYDLWRYDYTRRTWRLAGGVGYDKAARLFDLWEYNDQYDEDGNLVETEPYTTEDAAEALATLWSRRYTL